MLKRNLPTNTTIFVQLLSQLADLEKRVLIMRFVQNKTLKDVAKELSFTDTWIKIMEDNIIKKIEQSYDGKK